MAKRKATHEAWCLRCCGGGKLLKAGTKKECERECSSHGNLNHHECTVLERKS